MTREIEFLDYHLRSLGFEEEHLLDDFSIVSTYQLREKGVSIRVTVSYIAKSCDFEFDALELEMYNPLPDASNCISQMESLKDLLHYLRNRNTMPASKFAPMKTNILKHFPLGMN